MKTNQVKFKLLLLVLTLVVVVWILQSIVLNLNLEYGFRDGDWWIIRRYISLGPLSLNHLINALKLHAVYTYQIYYAGFITHLFGLNFYNLHQASHFFKFLATIAVFPMVFVITKNKMTAFITTVIYAVAYPTVGALYMFLTGGYFIAIILLNFFLMMYWFVLNDKQIKVKWLFFTLFIFLATLLLNPERMYPLIPLVLIVEFLWIWKNNWLSKAIKNSLKRIMILILPLVAFYTVYTFWFRSQVTSAFFTPEFFKALHLRVKSIFDGNWQLLLYPFSSFGSMFFHGDYWKFLGSFKTDSFIDFLFFLLRPMTIFAIATIVIMYLISKKPLKLILTTLIPVFVFGLAIFLTARNWLTINQSVRIHFDTNFIGAPALFGFYILSLSFSFFLAWLQDKNERNLLAPLIIGSGVSFLFVVFTWIGSDIQLVFMGPQRYLTIPAIGSSLFTASLIVLVFSKLRKLVFMKNFAWLTFFLLIPVIIINFNISNEFFSYELTTVGMRGVEQTRMKNKFWSLVPKVSNNEESLFYFDETVDKGNGYFNESTILAGFEDWTQFDHGRLLVVNRPNPGMLRTNVQCPEHTHESCIKILKDGLDVVHEERGIWYKDVIRGQTEPRFYKLSNFYAMRFVNKDIIDIKKKVLEELEVVDKVEQ